MHASRTPAASADSALRLTLAFLVLVLGCGAFACSTRPALPKQANDLNVRGVAALSSGDLSTAETRFELALEYSPRFVEAWINLGVVELRRGNFERARSLFAKARDLNANLPGPHHSLGLVAERRGELREAEGYYRAALAVDPGFVPSLSNQGRALFALGEFDDARKVFLKLLEVQADNDVGASGLSETLVKLNRPGEANPVLEAALLRHPDSAILRLSMARRYLRDERLDEALVYASAAATASDASTVTAAKALLAVIYLARGEAAAARREATDVLAHEPQDAVAQYVMRELTIRERR